MNYGICKVKQPGRLSPGSPAEGSLFNTPKFSAENEVERLTNENLELRNKVIEMQNEIKWIKINQKIELKNAVEFMKESGEGAIDKYNSFLFENNIVPLAVKCQKIIEKLSEEIRGKTFEEIIEKNEEEELGEYRDSSVDELNQRINAQEKQIRKHKEFIRTLKRNLETILVEHKKSKDLNKQHLREIATLKEKLEKKCNNN